MNPMGIQWMKFQQGLQKPTTSPWLTPLKSFFKSLLSHEQSLSFNHSMSFSIIYFGFFKVFLNQYLGLSKILFWSIFHTWTKWLTVLTSLILLPPKTLKILLCLLYKNLFMTWMSKPSHVFSNDNGHYYLANGVNVGHQIRGLQ
jgi:hypothetical protein